MSTQQMGALEHHWSYPSQQLTPAMLTLSANDIHLWVVELEQPVTQLELYQSLLAPAECARAERFRFARDRNHFIVARGVLRQMLGYYLNQDPHSLQFTYGPFGKPMVNVPDSSPPDSSPPVQFNLSHAGQLALYALTAKQALGVDVEFLRPIPDIPAIAKHFFAPQEQAALAALPANEQITGFYSCWTRKEAYLKALGSGLARPLDQFAVTLAPHEPPCLLAVEGDTEEAHRWSLYTFAPAPEYIGALAVYRDDWQLSCRWWPE